MDEAHVLRAGALMLSNSCGLRAGTIGGPFQRVEVQTIQCLWMGSGTDDDAPNANHGDEGEKRNDLCGDAEKSEHFEPVFC